MARKRPSLETFKAVEEPETPIPVASTVTEAPVKSIHKSVYIPPEVLEQLDLLALQERPGPGRKKKFNTLILEGIDLILRDRGLPSIEELTSRS